MRRARATKTTCDAGQPSTHVCLVATNDVSTPFSVRCRRRCCTERGERGRRPNLRRRNRKKSGASVGFRKKNVLYDDEARPAEKLTD